MNFFQRNANYIVILAVMASSTSGIFSKLITANSMTIGFYRLTFSLPLFMLPVLINKRQEIKAIAKRDIFVSMAGGVFLFVHFFCWFTAVKYTTIASGVTIAALHPIIVMIITVVLLKRKVSAMAVCGILTAIFGGSMVAGFDYSFNSENNLGNLLALGSAIGMGIYFAIGNQMRKKISSSVYISILFATCWVLFLIGMMITNTPFFGYPKTDWLWLILATVFCQLAAHGVFNWSMAYVSSLFVSALETGEIVFAAIIAYFIFGEMPTDWQCIGAAVVIVGLLLYNYSEGKERKNELQG